MAIWKFPKNHPFWCGNSFGSHSLWSKGFTISKCVFHLWCYNLWSHFWTITINHFFRDAPPDTLSSPEVTASIYVYPQAIWHLPSLFTWLVFNFMAIKSSSLFEDFLIHWPRPSVPTWAVGPIRNLPMNLSQHLSMSLYLSLSLSLYLYLSLALTLHLSWLTKKAHQ